MLPERINTDALLLLCTPLIGWQTSPEVLAWQLILESQRERVQNTGRLRAREENEARKSSTDNSLYHTQHWSQLILFVALLSLFIFEYFYMCYNLYKYVLRERP